MTLAQLPEKRRRAILRTVTILAFIAFALFVLTIGRGGHL
jgi:hypothetical protein